MFKRQTVKMFKIQRIQMLSKTCLKDKQYKCCEENMLNKSTKD